MSNYTQTTFFTPKDTLPATDPNKTIFGSAYDTEFGNIATAIATKYDASTTVIVLSGALSAGNLNVTGAAIPANGWYLSAVNTLAAASNSTLRMTINATGNVAILTPTSGVPFTVNGAANALAVTFTDGTQIFQVQSAAGNLYAGSSSNHAFNIITNNTVRMTIAAGGAFGIAVATTITAAAGISLSVNASAAGYAAAFTASTAGTSAINLVPQAAGLAAIDYATGLGTIGVSGAASQIISGSVAGDICLRAQLGNIKFSTVAGTHAISINGATATGTQTATFSATNKPGSATAAPIQWLPVLTAAGTQGYIPIFGA